MAREIEYLTPYQRILEDQRLAAGNQVGQSELQANPLLAARDTGLAPAAVETAPVSVAPNPFTRPQTFIRPPVPVSQMGVEQQIAWQALADDEVNRERAALNFEAAQRDRELAIEQARQSRELIAETPKLQAALDRSPDEYQKLKADLTSRFAAGALDPQAEKVLGVYESRYAKKEAAQADLTKAERAREEAARLKRIEAGHKQAEILGADVARQYAGLMETNPDKASEYLARQQRENVIVNLQTEAGLSEEQIAERYGADEAFKLQAAQLAAKKAPLASQEKARAIAAYGALTKLRNDSGFISSTGKQDYAKAKGIWTPEMEAQWEAERENVNSFAPNRAGIEGFEDVYRDWDYGRRPAPTVAPVVPATTSAPASGNVPTSQGRSFLSNVGRVATTAAEPLRRLVEPVVKAVTTPELERARQVAAATPAAEPVGTRKVINGVESIKLADGWHKIKTK